MNNDKDEFKVIKLFKTPRVEIIYLFENDIITSFGDNPDPDNKDID